MNEDLKWLAENVHEWPFGHNHAIVKSKYDDGFFYNYLAADNGFTREQWQDARDELSGKPSWDDAPEWAQWLAQDEDGRWVWYAHRPNITDEEPDMWGGDTSVYKFASRGRVLGLGDWRDTLERRPENHSAEPTEKVWRGPEDGLPQAGVEFEFSANGKAWQERVMLFNDGITCLMAHKQYPVNRWHYKCDDPDILCRPIRSEEDKAVEDMLEACKQGSISFPTSEEMMRRLYRAGYRKQEDK